MFDGIKTNKVLLSVNGIGAVIWSILCCHTCKKSEMIVAYKRSSRMEFSGELDHILWMDTAVTVIQSLKLWDVTIIIATVCKTSGDG